MQILLAQQTAALRETLLPLLGPGTDVAADGFAALLRLLERRYDLVLLDTGLPALPGLLLLEAWRDVDPETAFVLTGASPTFAEAREGIRLGAADFLPLPARAEEVAALTARRSAPAAVPRWRAVLSEQPALLRAYETLAAALSPDRVRPLYAAVTAEVFRLLPWLAQFVEPETFLAPPPETEPEALRDLLHRLWTAALALHPPTDSESLHQIQEHLLLEVDRPATQRETAERFYMSPSALSLLFSQQTGGSYTGYVTGLRLARAAHLLRTTDRKVSQVAETVGYQDVSYFTRQFRELYHLSPAELRQRSRFPGP